MTPMWEPPEQIPATFVEALERIAPASDRFAWLLPVWMPGDPWQPINRWFVYQMLPRLHVPSFVLLDLAGPNPRDRGTMHPRLGYRADPKCMIDRMQWLLWREHGAFGRPYWVVQGEHGGHRRRLDYAERAVRAARGQEPNVPDPGDLPYAGLDGRVTAKLAGFHKVEFFKQAIAAEEGNPDQFERDERDTISDMRRELDGWLETQVESVLDELPERTVNAALNELDARSRPVEGTDWERAVEHQRHQLIEQGW